MDVFDDSTRLEALIAAVCAGVQAACFEFHKRYNDLVCRTTLRWLRQKGCNALLEHSEDIIAASWFTILGRLHQVKHQDRIEWWIGKIVLRKVFGHVSGPKGCISDQLNRVPAEALEQARIKDADKVCYYAILVNELRARAYAQSETFGEMVRLYFEEGYTMEEIAKQYNESPAKLRSMFYRNLNDLRELFRDNDDDDDADDDDKPSES